MTLRVTADQAKLIFGQPGASKPAARRTQKARDALPENRVEAQITDFLALKGWTCTRRHIGVFVPFWAAIKGPQAAKVNVLNIGHKGEADWYCTRPTAIPGCVSAFDLECKAPGERPKPHQIQWLQDRRALGYLATWADSFDAFLAWYCHHWDADCTEKHSK